MSLFRPVSQKFHDVLLHVHSSYNEFINTKVYVFNGATAMVVASFVFWLFNKTSFGNALFWGGVGLFGRYVAEDSFKLVFPDGMMKIKKGDRVVTRVLKEVAQVVVPAAENIVQAAQTPQPLLKLGSVVIFYKTLS